MPPKTKRQIDSSSAVPVPPVEASAAAFESNDIPLLTPEKGHFEEGSVESFISGKRIGQRIKALRQKKSMGLVDLGLHTGLSASFLSQLETGRVVPTLRNLARIAMVFSKDLSYFFEAEPETLFRVHRAKDRLRLPQSGVEDPMYFFESLGYLVPDRQLDPYLAEFFPNEGREPRAHQHFGCEFLYVLKGQLEVRHGGTIQLLETSDAAYFDSSTVHSYFCAGDEPATVLIVTLQQPLRHSATESYMPRPAKRPEGSSRVTATDPGRAAQSPSGQR
jgi:transcriptional regulator with XRE-family HTH domain